MRQEYPDAGRAAECVRRYRRRPTSGGAKKVNIPTSPVAIALAGDPRGRPPASGTRSGAPQQARRSTWRPRTPGGSRCAMSTASPSPPPTAAVWWCTGSATAAKMIETASRVAENAKARPCAQVQPDAQGLPKRASGAVEQAEVGDRSSSRRARSVATPMNLAATDTPRGEGRGAGRRAAGDREPAWSAERRPAPCRTSVNTAPAGWVVSLLGALVQAAARGGAWLAAGAGCIPRPCVCGGDQADRQAAATTSPGDCRERRHAESAELPVRARDVHPRRHRSCWPA